MTISQTYINARLAQARDILQRDPEDDNYLIDREDEARRIITNLIEELQLNKNS